jgi:uncharacterized protein (DUF58 family)
MDRAAPLRDRLRRWLRGGTHAVSAPAAAPDAALLNPATIVTVDLLIALQRQAGKLDLTRASPVRARLGGSHPSRFRGRGMDYQESRGYQPGDDVRSMDWRVTARTGAPHVKLYQEERERPVILFLDFNPGMFFATRGMLKSVAAARAATLIAWAAAAHGDRVGAMIFADGHHELQPRGGRHGVLRLIRALVEHTDPRQVQATMPPAGALNAALARLRRVSRPGSLIFLLSDFYAIDGDTRNHLMRLRQHGDVAAIQFVDPIETAAPMPGRYGVGDGEQTRIMDVRSAAARRTYQDYFEGHHRAVEALMRASAVPLLRVSTVDDVGASLQRQFASTAPASALRERAA